MKRSKYFVDVVVNILVFGILAVLLTILFVVGRDVWYNELDLFKLLFHLSITFTLVILMILLLKWFGDVYGIGAPVKSNER